MSRINDILVVDYIGFLCGPPATPKLDENGKSLMDNFSEELRNLAKERGYKIIVNGKEY